MAMFAMPLAPPPAGMTPYRENRAFGPFGDFADELPPVTESGFSQTLWLDIEDSAADTFRTFYACCAGKVLVTGTQPGFSPAPDAPLTVGLIPDPVPEMSELAGICQAAEIECPIGILYHGASPESLENIITNLFELAKKITPPILLLDQEGKVKRFVDFALEFLQEQYLKGQLSIDLKSFGVGAGAVLGEVSNLNLSGGFFKLGIEVRTQAPLVYSLGVTSPRENYLDPVVLFHTLAHFQLSDGTPAMEPATITNSWLDVASKHRVLITFRDEWNAALVTGEDALVQGPDTVLKPLVEGQTGTLVAPDSWAQYECQIGVPANRKVTPIPSDQGAADSVIFNLSAPAHRVIGSVRSEDWFHREDPPISPYIGLFGEEYVFELPLYTEGNLVEPLIDGFAYFERLVKDLKDVNSSDHFILMAGWKTLIDFNLIKGMPDTSLRDLLTAANNNGAIIRALLWDFTGTLDNTDEVEFIAGLSNGQATLDSRHQFAGSHHAKFIIIRNSHGSVVYLGGIDINPNRLDGPRHRGPGELGLDAYHDVQCRIVGPAVVDATKTFVDRWVDHHYIDPAHFIPSADQFWDGYRLTGIEPPTIQNPPGATQLVQVARTYGKHSLAYAEFTGVRTIWATLVKAVARAKKYIYLEDQYLWNLALANELRNALDRIDHLIILIDGESCHQDTPIPGYTVFTNEECGRVRHEFLKDLVAADVDRKKLHVYTLKRGLTTSLASIFVHSKVVIVDDVFASIGSANLNFRGMTHDTELNAFVLDGRVDSGARKFARDLRIALWAEHLGWPPDSDTSRAKLADVDKAVKLLNPTEGSRFRTYDVNYGKNEDIPYAWDSIIDPNGS